MLMMPVSPRARQVDTQQQEVAAGGSKKAGGKGGKRFEIKKWNAVVGASRWPPLLGQC